MIDLVSGSIVLDGVDLATVEGLIVRKRVNCLTQDAFLFPDTLRNNVSPAGDVMDEATVSVLRRVGYGLSYRVKQTARPRGHLVCWIS